MNQYICVHVQTNTIDCTIILKQELLIDDAFFRQCTRCGENWTSVYDML